MKCCFWSVHWSVQYNLFPAFDWSAWITKLLSHWELLTFNVLWHHSEWSQTWERGKLNTAYIFQPRLAALPSGAADQAHEGYLQTLDGQFIWQGVALGEVFHHLGGQLCPTLAGQHSPHHVPNGQTSQAVLMGKHPRHCTTHIDMGVFSVWVS